MDMVEGVTKSKRRRKKDEIENALMKRLRQCMSYMESSVPLELQLATAIVEDNWNKYIKRSSVIQHRLKTSPIRNLTSTGVLREHSIVSISPLDPDFPYKIGVGDGAHLF